MRYTLGNLVADSDTLKLFKAADAPLITLRLINDDGSPVNLTGATATLEVYTTADRKIAAVASPALTTVTATAGAMSLTPTIAMINFGPGTYYAFVKHIVTAGTIVTITKNYFKLVIG
jgi:1-deoxy-D-xylulose 5-phosphate reductoisomerase